LLRELALLTAAASGLAAASRPDAEQIVRKSVDAIRMDWDQAQRYSFVERDVESKRNSPATAKTYKVLMLGGTPYNMVTAFNDQPLSPAEQAKEERKMRSEAEKRAQESRRERERRIAKYNRDRVRDHDMLKEMVDAFQFHVTGETVVDGRDCWVLDAEPKPGYEATDREGRVLKGMKGELWIDKSTNQWVKVHAEVVKPVTFYGFLAKVGPGTAFDLEQEPVTGNIWMPKRFSVRVNSTALGFLNENSTENDTYRDYQPMPEASALLQSTK
jgi:hypothetical protein